MSFEKRDYAKIHAVHAAVPHRRHRNPQLIFREVGVFLREGDGQLTVNGRTVEDYFSNPEYVYVVKQPLAVTDNEGKFNLVINVHGGGTNGQAGACRLGSARALISHDETNHDSLKANGFLEAYAVVSCVGKNPSNMRF